MLRHLDLFSGIGGWTLGFHATNQIQTVGFCEIEKFPQAVLKHHYPNIPIFEDIRELDYERMESAGLFRDGSIDILTCSYPCQPFSVAGKRQGEKDKRHLWPEVLRLIKDDRIRPYYVLGENVGGHIRLGLDSVSEDMESCNYRWRCFSIEAACIGANHRRQRVWWIAEDMAYSDSRRRWGQERSRQNDSKRSTREKQDSDIIKTSKRKPNEDVADSNGERLQRGKEARDIKESRKESEQLFTGRSNDVADSDSSLSKGRSLSNGVYEKHPNTNSSGTYENVADTDSFRQQGQGKPGKWGRKEKKGKREADIAFSIGIENQWSVEPNVGRVANGVPNRVHRLKALGNAIVPQMAYYIGLALLENEKRFFNLDKKNEI